MTTFTEDQIYQLAELARETHSSEIWALYYGGQFGRVDALDMTLSVLRDLVKNQKVMHDRLLDMSRRRIDPVIITLPAGTFAKMSMEPGDVCSVEPPRPSPDKPWYELFDWGGLFMLVTGIAVGLFMGYYFFH